MTIDLRELLQWANVLVVPALVYAFKLEHRITEMRTQLNMILDILQKAEK
ncbi:hypothetical protein [Lacisediminimonas profundi]|nr:hypothetical protein [Lacisediminimonas profundi]